MSDNLLYIVDEETKRIKHIDLYCVARKAIEESLKKFLTEKMAEKRAWELAKFLGFPNFNNSIIIKGEQGIFYKLDLWLLVVTEVTIEEMLPKIPEEDEIYMDAIKALKEEIVEFSSIEVEQPIVTVNNHCITSYKSKTFDRANIVRILSENYVSEIVAEKIATKIIDSIRGEAIFQLHIDSTDNYEFLNGKLRRIGTDLPSIKKVIIPDFKYIPDLTEEASRELYYYMNYGIILKDRKMASLNIHHVYRLDFGDDYVVEHIYVKQEVFGIKIMWRCENDETTFTPDFDFEINGSQGIDVSLDKYEDEIDAANEALIERILSAAGKVDTINGVYPFGGQTAKLFVSRKDQTILFEY